jgi:hypothetical protein
MTRAKIYHRVLAGLMVFYAAAPEVVAVESKKLTDVWPVGQKQQYLYMYEGNVIGEQWMELRKIPRTEGRYELVNTIEVDGVPYGSPWKSHGTSVCEMDEWGRPIGYECEVFGAGPDEVRRVRADINYPQVDFYTSQNGAEEEVYSQAVGEDARLVDFIFLGPYDLALRLQPINPQHRVITRDWIVPNMSMAIGAQLDVLYEETIVTPDGTEYPTVRVDVMALLVDLWVAPDGKLVKAEIMNPPTTVFAGKTIPPGGDAVEPSRP